MMQELMRELEVIKRRLERLEAVEVPRAIGARVYNSVNLVLANSTPTLLTFNSERWDTDAIHSQSTNTGRLTAPVPGYYLVAAHVNWDASAAGFRELRVQINSATLAALVTQSPISGGSTLQSISTIVRLNTADYVEIVGQQTTGGALSIVAAAEFGIEAMIHRLG